MNAILIALAALIALSSCTNTSKACERNYGPCGSISRDILIQIRVRIDSATVYMTVPIHDTVSVRPTDTVVPKSDQHKDRPSPAELPWQLHWLAVFLLGTLGGLIVRMILR